MNHSESLSRPRKSGTNIFCVYINFAGKSCLAWSFLLPCRLCLSALPVGFATSSLRNPCVSRVVFADLQDGFCRCLEKPRLFAVSCQRERRYDPSGILWLRRVFEGEVVESGVGGFEGAEVFEECLRAGAFEGGSV